MSVVVLRMYRGDDRSWPMTLTADGDPIDLTGATDARFTAVRVPEGDAVIACSLGDGVAITNPLTGAITVTLAGSNTSGLDIPDTYLRLYWDVEVTDVSGNHRTWPEDANGRPRLGRLLVFGDTSR